MLLEIEGNFLKITDNDDLLKPSDVFQLRHWGFEKVENYYVAENSDLVKIINYLNESSIKHTLSASVQRTYDAILNEINQLQEFLHLGQKIKDGNFDKNDFYAHVQFLKDNIPNRDLKDHQKKAFYHLSSVKNGANFSVPGSGKTTVVLSVYEKLRLEGKVNTIVVVGPTACFGSWKDEFEEVLGRKPDYKILAGGDQHSRKQEYYIANNKNELYMTTFQTLQNDKDDMINLLNNTSINAYVVIDEAHYIKQIEGNRAKAVLDISKYAIYRCILTGTPLPKGYSDVFNYFEFLWPNNEIISEEKKVKIQVLEANRDYATASELLNDSISPLCYRVRKKELNLSPQRFNVVSDILMNEYERKVYEAVYYNIAEYSRNEYVDNYELVDKLRRGRMIRLRQCLSFTYLMKTAIDDYDEQIIDDSMLEDIVMHYENLEKPAKLIRLVDMVTNFQEKREKVVIWSYFIETIKMIEKELQSRSFNVKKIIGETPSEKTDFEEHETREKIKNEFVDSNSGLDILLANPAACAESISLHKTCHNAIYYDLSYNGAQFLQSLDRIHRVGGSEKKEAHYYFLQYANTMENRILKNLENKRDKMYQIIEGDFNIYSLDMFEGLDEIDDYEGIFLDNDS